MSRKLKNNLKKKVIVETVRSVGRPKKKDSEKVIYQKIPIRYETYKRLKELTIQEDTTFTDLIEDMLKATYDI